MRQGIVSGAPEHNPHMSGWVVVPPPTCERRRSFFAGTRACPGGTPTFEITPVGGCDSLEPGVGDQLLTLLGR